MPPRCHEMFKVMSSAPQRASFFLADGDDFGPSCTGHPCFQSSPVYCKGEHPVISILPPSLCPNPGCSLMWSVVSSSRSWSPSLLFYWSLYTGGCIHTSWQSRWWPTYNSCLFSSDTKPTMAVSLSRELLEMTICSVVLEVWGVEGEKEGHYTLRGPRA